MLISNPQRFVFIHVPRTGGTSIRSVLTQEVPSITSNHDRHATACEVKKNIIWEEYFSCAIVRNPWDRLLSYYMFVRKNRGIGAIKEEPPMPFDEWLQQDNNHPWLRPQYDFTHMRGLQLISFVGRFEQLQRSFNVICGQLGIKNVILPYMLATPHTNYRDYYDQTTKEIIKRRYMIDIDAFGYIF